MTSVRSIAGRGLQRFDLLIERIAKHLRHLVIEPQASDDCSLAPEFAIGARSGAVCRQAHNVLTAPITASGNAIDYQFSALGEVHNKWLAGAANPHRSILLVIDENGEAYDTTGQKWSRA